ncbi:MAG: flagellin [Acidimicrobiales bacterium]
MSDFSARITPSVLDTQVITGLQGDERIISQLAQQMATGNNISRPSDDPVGAVQTLSIQAALARAQQYQANAGDGLTRLGLSNSTLSSAMSQLQKIRTLVVSVANSVTDSTGLTPVATQVSQLESSLVAMANTTFGGQSIFGGSSGSPVAYQVTIPSAGPPPVPGSSTYAGSGGAPVRTVAPGISAPAGVAGPFGDGTSSTVDVFKTLNQLVSDLQAGNVSAVTGADATALDSAMAQVNQAAGQVGASYAQMQTLQTQAQTTSQELQVEYSHVQSADLAEVSSNYAQAQTNYQAALYAAAQVTKLPSLVSFL